MKVQVHKRQRVGKTDKRGRKEKERERNERERER